jgi:hypothetical protein
MKETKKFLCHYRHDDAQWSIIIDAYDFEDAEVRIKKLGYLILDGELMGIVPARLGFIAKLFCWFKNL